MLRSIFAGLLFGASAFGGLLLAQVFNSSVQLSQDPRGPLPVDTAQNVYLTNNRHLNYIVGTSAAPTLGVCAGGTLVAGSTDTSGQVSGASGTSCIVNFGNTWGTAPRCVTSGSISSATTGPVSNTATTAALTMTVVATGAGVWSWFCNSVS
ncbi:MAG: hypothetical protein HRJ53_30270 [Acidobacteria bacterium Pan2503]|uniref:Uncharacterized protein n=1 Tax=Candidatus Acidiferrum panamense TaxID=2741543 RepID=A0A7V8NXF5_9BACT|nr:hypothetical protein [Candidatus Acidoferrum panamensis]